MELIAWGALSWASEALGCADALPVPAMGFEAIGGGVAGNAPLPFVCALAPQRRELEGPQPPTGRPCRLRRPREPGDPGPAARPGGEGGRKGGRGLGGAFPVAGSVPGLRPARGPSSYQGRTGAAGDSSSAWGAPPGDECTGATHPGLGLPSCPPRASGTPPGLLLPFTDFLLKSVWLGYL